MDYYKASSILDREIVNKELKIKLCLILCIISIATSFYVFHNRDLIKSLFVKEVEVEKVVIKPVEVIKTVNKTVYKTKTIYKTKVVKRKKSTHCKGTYDILIDGYCFNQMSGKIK